jgi:NO-binding membrane sensor protein with MHYT domain
VHSPGFQLLILVVLVCFGMVLCASSSPWQLRLCLGGAALLGLCLGVMLLFLWSSFDWFCLVRFDLPLLLIPRVADVGFSQVQVWLVAV